jgi:hypothetical protein
MSSEQDQVKLIAERIARRLAQNNSSSSSSSATSSSGQTGEAGDVDNELATLRASLAQLQKRLSQVESQMKEDGGERLGPAGGGGATLAQRVESSGASNRGETQPAPQTRSPWLSGIYVPATHPSDERFGVAEAAVSELVDFFEKEKTCSMEPGNKPCDHCAMCSSRGF